MPRRLWTQEERDEAARILREMVPVGSTIYTILRHVSTSGTTRDIAPIFFPKHNDDRDLTVLVAKVMDLRVVNEGCRIDGGGEDKGHMLVHYLSHTLYGDGRALFQRWL